MKIISIQLCALITTMMSAAPFVCGHALILVHATASVAASAPFFPSKLHTKQKNGNHHKSILLQSSNAVNRLYAKPPHDVYLYDVLQVRSNATLVEIQKSWRRLSREWHPDKVAVRRRKRKRNTQADDQTLPNPPPPPPPLESNASITHNEQRKHDKTTHQPDISIEDQRQSEDDKEEEYARQKLAELTNAYEILSDDHTRLLYHRYGLIGGTDAAIQLLTGAASTNNLQTDNMMGAVGEEEHGRLLELMGYPPKGYQSGDSSFGWSFPRHHSHHEHGTHHHQTHHRHSQSASSLQNHQHQQRLAYLASTITERLRPLVEGTISQNLFVNEVYRECKALKTSALGAQILRCIGRGYRIEGYRVLRTMHNHRKKASSNGNPWERRDRYHGQRRRKGSSTREVTDKVHDTWRDAKHYASAALASGKLMVMEQKIKKLEEDHVRHKRERQRQKMDEERVGKIQSGRVGRGDPDKGEEDIFEYNIGALPGDDSELEDDCIVNDIGAFSDDESEDFLGLFDNDETHEDELEQELQHVQHKKTYSALLSIRQMEALWKITKIELDRVIREACRLIMAGDDDTERGWHAFCPPEDGYHASSPRGYRKHRRRHTNPHHRGHDRQSRADGWVGTTGEGVTLEVGRLRAAAAMILVGDIMVQCSKDGTARS